MKAGLWDYVRAAFNARPRGMFIAPNWVGVAGFAMAGGFVHPALWLVGAGLELGYLFSLLNSARFRRFVNGTKLAAAQGQWRRQLDLVLRDLDTVDQRRYRALEARCQGILETLRRPEMNQGLQDQAEGLGKLLWIYLRLLRTKEALTRMLNDSVDLQGDGLDGRIAKLQKQMGSPKMTDALRESLRGQAEILQQRLEKQAEARQKLVFLDAELARVEQQVELIREQAALAHDPEAMSQRIDQIAATLGGTTQWIQEQQQILGQVEDLLAKPMPVPLRAVAEG